MRAVGNVYMFINRLTDEMYTVMDENVSARESKAKRNKKESFRYRSKVHFSSHSSSHNSKKKIRV